MHFQWADELTSSFVAPAGDGLRAQVKGGGCNAPRPAVVDPQGLTANRAARDRPGKLSAASRRLVIQACEVNDGGDGWRMSPPPTRRGHDAFMDGGRGDRGDPALEVVLKDGTALLATLTPSVQAVRDIADQRTKSESACRSCRMQSRARS